MMEHLWTCPQIGAICDKNDLHLANNKAANGCGFRDDWDLNDTREKECTTMVARPGVCSARVSFSFSSYFFFYNLSLFIKKTLLIIWSHLRPIKNCSSSVPHCQEGWKHQCIKIVSNATECVFFGRNTWTGLKNVSLYTTVKLGKSCAFPFFFLFIQTKRETNGRLIFIFGIFLTLKIYFLAETNATKIIYPKCLNVSLDRSHSTLKSTMFSST